MQYRPLGLSGFQGDDADRVSLIFALVRAADLLSYSSGAQLEGWAGREVDFDDSRASGGRRGYPPAGVNLGAFPLRVLAAEWIDAGAEDVGVVGGQGLEIVGLGFPLLRSNVSSAGLALEPFDSNSNSNDNNDDDDDGDDDDSDQNDSLGGVIVEWKDQDADAQIESLDEFLGDGTAGVINTDSGRWNNGVTLAPAPTVWRSQAFALPWRWDGREETRSLVVGGPSEASSRGGSGVSGVGSVVPEIESLFGNGNVNVTEGHPPLPLCGLGLPFSASAIPQPVSTTIPSSSTHRLPSLPLSAAFYASRFLPSPVASASKFPATYARGVGVTTSAVMLRSGGAAAGCPTPKAGGGGGVASPKAAVRTTGATAGAMPTPMSPMSSHFRPATLLSLSAATSKASSSISSMTPTAFATAAAAAKKKSSHTLAINGEAILTTHPPLTPSSSASSFK